MYSNELKKDLRQLAINRYHKIENQFQATFKIVIEEKEIKYVIYEILIMANILWHTGSLNWTFNGPHSIDDEFIFECILNTQEDDQPLKWSHIEID